MKILSQLSVFVVLLLSLNARADVVVMQPLTTFGPHGDGSLRPDDVPGLTWTNQFQRGMAYNPTTGHLLVVDRTDNGGVNYTVFIYDGQTGASLGTLPNITPLAGGNAAFPLNLIGVADDGAIYAANLTSATATNETRIYRWATEIDAPTLVSPALPPTLADDPGAGDAVASQKRWGDTMSVRGSGLGTQILLANRGTFAAIFTPDDGSMAHFTPKRLTTDVGTGDIGTGLSFGSGATFWGTSGASGNGPLIHLSFDTNAGTATTLTNFPSPRLPGTISPILVMPGSNLLAGITMVGGADVVRLYDITDPTNPVLQDRKSFVTPTNNAVFGGSLALGTNGVLYALDSDNGIMAFTLTVAGSNPLPPAFFLNPANQFGFVGTNVTLNAGADSTLPITYEWLKFGTNFNSSATNASLTLTNVQLSDNGNYSLVASNSAGAVTSSVAVVTIAVPTSGPTTWNLAAGGSWNSATSWNPMVIPNGIGASAIFNNAASGSNPAQTGNRAVTADAPQVVGSIIFNNDAANAFTTTISAGGGSVNFDETNAGPAAVIIPTALGTGNNTLVAPTILTDNLVVTVHNITASSVQGGFNFTAAVSGPGGFTKLGDGGMTFGTGAKTYTGPTVLAGGRMRMSVAAQPQQTASFTIAAGGQLDQITAGTLTMGTGPLNLNGAGPTSGPFAAFPGAIRNDTGLISTINNVVVLQSDTLIHVQGTAGSTTFANSISGPGKLTLTSPNHDANLGSLILNGANTYAGGTLVDGGILVVGPSASLGSGNVTVKSAHAVFAGSSAKLTIQDGAGNVIADTATLSLAGGNVGGLADDGYAELGAGVNDTVGGLILGGVPQGAGTYGSTLSSATTQNNEYFAGTGIITVVPAAVPPTLTVTLAAPNVILSWPTSFTGFNLVSSTDVTVARNTWTAVTNPVVVVGPNNTVTVEASGGGRFFTLKQ